MILPPPATRSRTTSAGREPGRIVADVEDLGGAEADRRHALAVPGMALVARGAAAVCAAAERWQQRCGAEAGGERGKFAPCHAVHVSLPAPAPERCALRAAPAPAQRRRQDEPSGHHRQRAQRDCAEL